MKTNPIKTNPAPELTQSELYDPIVAVKGDCSDLMGSEIFISVHCQHCGERITDASKANVIFPRRTASGEQLSFQIVCPDCDLPHMPHRRITNWMRLYEFIETVARSVGMKAERPKSCKTL